MLVLLNGCVTVRQPVHHHTQHRCSTEEVPFVVKPYVAQYLWLVTVFVNFCVPTSVSFSVCQCCKYAFFMCAEVVCTNVFLLSDHQIFVCFCLCWRTDKNKQKKKKVAPILHPSPPPSVRPCFLPKWRGPSPHHHKQQPHQAVANGTIDFALSCPHLFETFCTFCTSRLLTFLWEFFLCIKKRNIHRKYLSHTAVTEHRHYATTIYTPSLKGVLQYGMQTRDVYLIPRQNFNQHKTYQWLFFLIDNHIE